VPRRRGLPLKACVKCKRLVEPKVEVCPNCGSRVFSDDWEGLVVILDPESSIVSERLGIEKPGMYALKVR